MVNLININYLQYNIGITSYYKVRYTIFKYRFIKIVLKIVSGVTP